jgi:hypothetical protein
VQAQKINHARSGHLTLKCVTVYCSYHDLDVIPVAGGLTVSERAKRAVRHAWRTDNPYARDDALPRATRALT